MLKRWLLLTCLLALSACASLPDGTSPKAWLKPGVRVSLPAPGISPEIHAQQLLTSTYRGREHSLMVMLDADSQQIALVGLSMLGIRLFTLQYDDQGLRARQHVVAPGLPQAAQVLSDIMLSYWPAARWGTLLPSGWRLVDAGLQRQLLDTQGKVIMKIDYVNVAGVRRPVQVHQLAFGYDIRIQDLDD